MLALTENVTDIVKKLAEEVPEISGLRIAAEADGQSLSVSPADHAAQDDQVVEQDGATIYVDGPASELLADKVLDGAVDEDGNISVRAWSAGLTDSVVESWILDGLRTPVMSGSAPRSVEQLNRHRSFDICLVCIHRVAHSIRHSGWLELRPAGVSCPPQGTPYPYVRSAA